MIDHDTEDQTETANETESDERTFLSTSRRGILAATTAGVGLASLGTAQARSETASEEDESQGDGGPPWEEACKDDPTYWCSQGHQLSPRELEAPPEFGGPDETYEMAPKIERMNDNELVLVSRPSPPNGHVHNDGYIVSRVSEDWGETWSDPVTVDDHPDYDTRNNSIIYDRESDRLIVHYRYWDAQNNTQHAELYKFSEDHGRSWSESYEVDLEYATGRISAPFGGQARTSNGLLKTWYGFDDDGNYGVVEALFSTDGGKTWGDNVLVGDSTDVSGRILTEPVPVALTEDKVIMFGRDNDSADFFAIKSSDGGTSWGDPVYFNPADMERPTAFWVRKTNANELTAMWGDRTDEFYKSMSISGQLAWQDPTLIEDEPIQRFATTESDRGMGYPSFVPLGRDRRHTLITYWDDVPNDDGQTVTKNWLTSLGGEGAVRGSSDDSQTVTTAGDAMILHGEESGTSNISRASDGSWDSNETLRIPIEFEEEFESPPAVNTTITNAASGLNAVCAWITEEGFSLRIRNYGSGSREWMCNWTAIGEAPSDD